MVSMPKPHQDDLPFAAPVGALRRPPPASVRELEIRAQALYGHALGDIARGLGVDPPPDPKRAKGFVGQLIERALGADPAAGEKPDFPELGVELKTIPMHADGRIAESTFCCSIRMDQADQAVWATSRLRKKLARVLWVPVQSARTNPLLERRVGRARLWEPSSAESDALQRDWEDLMGALGSGRQVDAYEGEILQMRPKGANAAVRSLAPTEDGAAPTLPLGFYLRVHFTQSILLKSSA